MKKMFLTLFFLSFFLLVPQAKAWCDDFDRNNCTPPWQPSWLNEPICDQHYYYLYPYNDSLYIPNVASWYLIKDIILGNPPNCVVSAPNELASTDGVYIERNIEPVNDFEYSNKVKTSFVGQYGVCPCYDGCPNPEYYNGTWYGCSFVGQNCSERQYKGYIGLEFYSGPTKIFSVRFGTMFPENQTYVTNELRIYCNGTLKASENVSVEIFANWNTFSAKRTGNLIEAKAGNYTLTANCPAQAVNRIVVSSGTYLPYPFSRQMYIDDACLSVPQSCRTCDPVGISRSGSAYYLLSGWCLFSNLVMCNPILLSILFLVGMVLFIIIRLKMGK